MGIFCLGELQVSLCVARTMSIGWLAVVLPTFYPSNLPAMFLLVLLCVNVLPVLTLFHKQVEQADLFFFFFLKTFWVCLQFQLPHCMRRSVSRVANLLYWKTVSRDSLFLPVGSSKCCKTCPLPSWQKLGRKGVIAFLEVDSAEQK